MSNVCWRVQPPVEPNIVVPIYWERFLAKTTRLTTPEIGGYWMLLLSQWNTGYLESTAARSLAPIMRCTPQSAKSIWERVGKYFKEACPCGCGAVRNRRMEEVRAEQIANIERGKTNGAKGGRPPKEKPTQNPNHNPNHNLNTNPEKSHPSSEIRSPDPSVPITGSDLRGAVPVSTSERPRHHAPSVSGLSPLEFHRKHGHHEPGFCDWHCFPSDLYVQFAARIAAQRGGISVETARADVREWAEGVRASGVMPSGKMYDFWNAQWERTHGSSQPIEDGAAGRQTRTNRRLDTFVEHG